MKNIESRKSLEEEVPGVDLLTIKSEGKVWKPPPGSYGIQVGAYSSLKNAEATRNRLIDGLDKEVYIQESNGLFKVIIAGFDELTGASAFLPTVKSRGFIEYFVLKFK